MKHFYGEIINIKSSVIFHELFQPAEEMFFFTIVHKQAEKHNGILSMEIGYQNSF